ncbi:hypothetical protein TWF730_009430 [Orbilia blumenaviensis]|uniref:Uncharacterized protein n=1 Tax=Orbilia blumenaviensis TaxID=1796055 RepID=A0AAV9V1C6_9PEZI
MKSLIFSLFVASVIACTSSTTTRLTTTLVACNANNCLRAVRATNSPSRTLDCSSYFKTTVTPATITHTDFTTVTFTEEEAIYLTETETEFATLTEQLYITDISTEKTTTTITVAPPTPPAKVKRQETAIPSNIPAYASPCPNAAAYSSACSCIGVVATTITLDAPSTTVIETVSETVTLVETIRVDATITTTDMTETQTSTISTTKTEVETARATACIWQLQNGLPGQYVQFRFTSDLHPGFTIPRFTTLRSDATKFIISPDGRLSLADGGTLTTYRLGSFNKVSYIFKDHQPADTYPIFCTVSSLSVVTCASATYSEFGLTGEGFTMQMGVPNNNWAPFAGVGPLTILCLPE